NGSQPRGLRASRFDRGAVTVYAGACPHAVHILTKSKLSRMASKSGRSTSNRQARFAAAQWSGLDSGNWQDCESLQEYVFSSRAEALIVFAILFTRSATIVPPAFASRCT